MLPGARAWQEMWEIGPCGQTPGGPSSISMKSVPEPRRVAILLYPGVQSLDVTGPLEVFTGADSAISHLAARGRSP